MRLSNTEQLAVLTALQSAVKDRVSELRAEADADLLDAYDADGVTKKALKVDGVKVGDYLVVLTKGEWAVDDAEAFGEFALACGFADEVRSIRPECMREAVSVLEEHAPHVLSPEVKVDPKWQSLITNTGGTATYLDSGEIVPGLRFVPQRVKCTQVRGCRPADVMPLLRQLGGVDQLLLGEPAITDNSDS